MKYAKVTVEVAVADDDDAVNVVDELLFYALSRGLYEEIGMGQVRLVEERPMGVDEDGTPIWAPVEVEA